MNVEELKRRAGERAVDFVASGMVLGLGTGSTAIFAMRRIADLLGSAELRDVVGIPTSTQVERDARGLGIPLTTLNENPQIDLTIDGADEVDGNLNLIKGGGGALLHEKIVAQASRREIIVVDERKLSATLGVQWPVPVEVTPFGWQSQELFLQSLGARVSLRGSKQASRFRTDEGNFILDCDFGALSDPEELARLLSTRAGIVEHGLFLNVATDIIVGTSGGVRHMERSRLEA